MWLCSFVVTLFALLEVAIAGGQYSPYNDPSCTNVVRPPRDPADSTNIYLRRREQRCNLILPKGNVGTFVYVINSKNVPIFNNGIIHITPSNLDTGSSASQSASAYATAMVKTSIPGQILGKTLGGPGNELANIFPQSPSQQSLWTAFESQIYSCLKNGSSGANLLWTFHYNQFNPNQAYRIDYTAQFLGGTNSCQTLTQSFTN